MGQIADFETLASNLFALEINTIVKANMTGQKFPSPGEALDDIASDYEDELVALESASSVAPASLAPTPRGTTAASTARFGAIAARSEALLALLARAAESSPDDDADYYMLCRIRDNARRLAPIAQGPDIKPTQTELALIRKVWELGTEEIAFQTVIQLDGDVVTRLQPKYANASQGIVHAIHGEAVGVSVGFWKSLVELVETFFGVTMRALSGKSP